MYPVSEAFLEAVKQNTRRYYWTGKITTKAGTEYEFGAEDIVKGSGTITAQCCGNTEIELGTVYAAELDISLFATIDRYTLQDAVVEMFYHLRISTGTDLSELNQSSGEETESGQEGSNSESGQVITGVRRCGKSCLMETIADELKKGGIPEGNIWFFDLDSKDYNKITKADQLE